MSRRTKVFLSYARDDASDLVKRVRAYLEPSGAEAWVDVLDIPAGVNWRENIEASIRDCDAFLLIMTPKSMESMYVKEEVEIAKDHQKHLIPLAMGEVKAADWLGRTQYIRFREFNDATALGKLTGDLKSVWELIETRISDLRFNVIGEELAPILDHLETYLKTLPRPIVRPEVLWACAEFTENLNAGLATRPLVDLIGDWRAGLLDTSKWKYKKAYEKNAIPIKKILDQALKTVQIPDVKVVPFVLVVMTAEEAAELRSETLLESIKGLAPHYKKVLARLDAAGVHDWASRYHERPELWQPFDSAGTRTTLVQLIETELARRESGSATELRRPRFIDVRGLDDRPEELNELRESGCVVIMDIVSVCHPKLLTAYRRSLLDIFPKTFLLKMAPFEPVPVFGKKEEERMTLPWVQRMDSFFYERHEQLDPKCDVAGQEADFRRFMREKIVMSFLKNYSGFRHYVHGAGAK
jgi:hypothetical protein